MHPFHRTGSHEMLQLDDRQKLTHVAIVHYITSKKLTYVASCTPKKAKSPNPSMKETHDHRPSRIPFNPFILFVFSLQPTNKENSLILDIDTPMLSRFPLVHLSPQCPTPKPRHKSFSREISNMAEFTTFHQRIVYIEHFCVGETQYTPTILITIPSTESTQYGKPTTAPKHNVHPHLHLHR